MKERLTTNIRFILWRLLVTTGAGRTPKLHNAITNTHRQHFLASTLTKEDYMTRHDFWYCSVTIQTSTFVLVSLKLSQKN